VIPARIWFNSFHSSIEYDLVSVMKHLGMTIVTGNMDRSFEERPDIPGWRGFDFGEEVRGRMHTMTCIESDFAGCDMIFMGNPSDFHHRIAHYAKFRPVCMYLWGQWLDNQVDELAGKINGQLDRGEQPNIWVATYSKVEEEYLRPRVYKQLQDRIHHIRFCKKFEDYAPWVLNGDKPPERHNHIFTTVNDFHSRGKACNLDEWQECVQGLNHRLAGRNSEQLGGLGLIPFDQLKQEMAGCAAYMGVPAWPAPLVLNFAEAMMTGAPVAFYDNGRGAAHEGIFDNGIGCCSADVSGLRSFLQLCLKDKTFQQEQVGKSIERAKEFFDFEKQVLKWRDLFNQIKELWA